MEKNSVTPDAYTFLRTRAAELLDEGETRLARRLLARIDKEQIRRIRESLTTKTTAEQ